MQTLAHFVNHGKCEILWNLRKVDKLFVQENIPKFENGG